MHPCDHRGTKPEHLEPTPVLLDIVSLNQTEHTKSITHHNLQHASRRPRPHVQQRRERQDQQLDEPAHGQEDRRLLQRDRKLSTFLCGHARTTSSARRPLTTATDRPSPKPSSPKSTASSRTVIWLPWTTSRTGKSLQLSQKTVHLQNMSTDQTLCTGLTFTLERTVLSTRSRTVR